MRHLELRQQRRLAMRSPTHRLPHPVAQLRVQRLRRRNLRIYQPPRHQRVLQIRPTSRTACNKHPSADRLGHHLQRPRQDTPRRRLHRPARHRHTNTNSTHRQQRQRRQQQRHRRRRWRRNHALRRRVMRQHPTNNHHHLRMGPRNQQRRLRRHLPLRLLLHWINM